MTHCKRCGLEIRENDWISGSGPGRWHGNPETCIKRLLDQHDENTTLIAALTRENNRLRGAK